MGRALVGRAQFVGQSAIQSVIQSSQLESQLPRITHVISRMNSMYRHRTWTATKTHPCHCFRHATVHLRSSDMGPRSRPRRARRTDPTPVEPFLVVVKEQCRRSEEACCRTGPWVNEGVLPGLVPSRETPLCLVAPKTPRERAIPG